jgi:GNAT superfamily N-acetyltransferase
MRATTAEQGVPNKVTATEADLLSTLNLHETNIENPTAHRTISHNAKALVLVAPEGEIAGMAIFSITYVAWAAKPGSCLEDLFVLPKYRCRGYARLLVQAVVREARDLGCIRTEWLCYKENHRALGFYRSIGALELDALTFLRLDGDAMESFADGDHVRQ